MIGGLEITQRAELVGLRYGEYVELGRSDPRIVCHETLATEGGVARLRRWLDAGRPEPDISEIQFHGHDEVRELVRRVVAQLPKPVGWHTARWVPVVEVGRRGIAGWAGFPFEERHPDGDEAHLVALLGSLTDDELELAFAHEVAHTFHRALIPEFPREAVATLSSATVLKVLAEVGGGADEMADRMYRDELLADRCAEAWLGRRMPAAYASNEGRRRRMHAEVATAAKERTQP